MTSFDEALVYLAQLSMGILIILCLLYVLDTVVQAIQSRILIFKLKRTPFVLNNTENQNDQ